jgi:hypothetical protein
MITVEKMDERTFKVTIENGTTTIHTVTVDPSYRRKLTGDRVSAEDLVKKSFEFLLERESNTSILPKFDLPVIQRYFSEYEGTIARMF